MDRRQICLIPSIFKIHIYKNISLFNLYFFFKSMTYVNECFLVGQTLNDNRLLEFRLSREPDQTSTGQELRVRSATLWLRVDLRGARPRSRVHQCQPTLWVFAVNRDMEDDITRLGTQVSYEKNERLRAR